MPSARIQWDRTSARARLDTLVTEEVALVTITYILVVQRVRIGTDANDPFLKNRTTDIRFPALLLASQK